MGLKDQLRGIIPDRALCHLSDHFDVIGDIAVVSLSPYLLGMMGQLLMPSSRGAALLKLY